MERKLRELAAGPRVDSEPVWEYLDNCEQAEQKARHAARAEHAAAEHEWLAKHPDDPGCSQYALVSSDTQVKPQRMLPGRALGLDRGRPVRHLGTFLYEPGRPILPAGILAGNIGATLEVRISAAAVGVGVSEADWRMNEWRLEQDALRRLAGEDPGNTPETFDSAGWRLGWRGTEHARMSRDSRTSCVWSEGNFAESTNKRRRTMESKPPHLSPPKVLSEAERSWAAWSFWDKQSLAQRKLWGTDVYTDDSDVLAMCVHAGWLEAPSLPGVPAWLGGGGATRAAHAWSELSNRADGAPQPSKPDSALLSAAVHATCDLAVVLRIAPKLIFYKGSHRGGLRSRSWGNTHDGASLVVESVELRPAGFAACHGRRAAKVRMHQMASLRDIVNEGVSLASHCTSGERPFWKTM